MDDVARSTQDAPHAAATLALSLSLPSGEVVLQDVQLQPSDRVSSLISHIPVPFQGRFAGSALHLVTPAGSILDGRATIEEARVSDGDVLSLVTEAFNFQNAVYAVSEPGALFVSDDGLHVSKRMNTDEESGLRMASPIPKNFFCFAASFDRGTGGHIQIGLTTAERFVDGGRQRARQRECDGTWGVDSGSSKAHQFKTTLRRVKQHIADLMLEAEVLTFAVYHSMVFVAINDEVVGMLANSVPVDEDVYIFALIEPREDAVVSLRDPKPDTVTALCDAMDKTASRRTKDITPEEFEELGDQMDGVHADDLAAA